MVQIVRYRKLFIRPAASLFKQSTLLSSLLNLSRMCMSLITWLPSAILLVMHYYVLSVFTLQCLHVIRKSTYIVRGLN
jgi:hypothetical protein